MVQYAPLSPARSATLDVSSLAAWSMDELRRVSAAFSGVENILLPVLNVELDKPRDGMIILADGTNFNPGAGAGIYGRSAGAWEFLGGAAGSLPVLDTTSIVEDPADTTKEMRIDVEAVAPGTVRVLAMPDQNVDLAPGATFQADLDVPSQDEAEAGEATTERVWTAMRVKQAIDALGGGGGGLPVVDTTSIVEDPSDGTKEMRIDVGAVAPSTVRVLTMPNQNIDLTPGTGTFPALSAANTWTADQTIAAANSLILGVAARFKFSDTNRIYTDMIGQPGANIRVNHFAKPTAGGGDHFGAAFQLDSGASAAGNKVGVYGAAESGSANSDIWGMNALSLVSHNVSAWGIEVNINNQRGVDAPDPRTAGHQLGVDIVCAGNGRPSAAIATLSTALGNRWKHGIWFDNIGGSAGATLIKVNNNVDVDYGLDLQGGTFVHGAIRLPNGEDIRFRNAANSGDIAVLDLDNGNQLILGRSLANGKLFLNVSGTPKILSEGPTDSGGAGFKLLRVPN